METEDQKAIRAVLERVLEGHGPMQQGRSRCICGLRPTRSMSAHLADVAIAGLRTQARYRNLPPVEWGDW